jgi:hypothetical protein
VLAVTLRAAFFASGCLEIDELLPDVLNTIEVPVTDRPLQLQETDLIVRLGVDETSSEFDALFGATVSAASQAFVAGSSDDIEALLDAMQARSSDSTAFGDARLLGYWDSVLLGALPSADPNLLRSLIEAWMTAGTAKLKGPNVVQGHLWAAGESPGRAYFDVESVAGVDAARAGIPVENQVSWSSDPDDVVLLGSADRIRFPASDLITELALEPASADATGASSVPEALSAIVRCDLVGTALAASGAAPGEAYAGCNAECTTTLCEHALEAMWRRARDVSATTWDFAALDVNATGTARVDDHARPSSFEGSWIGSLAIGEISASLGGIATGSTPPPPN